MKRAFNTLRGMTAVLCLLVMSGCASLTTYNTATGREEFILIPTSEEVAMGQVVHEDINSEYKISTDTAQAGRLRSIGERVARVADRQDYTYQFYLIDKEELNAFTTPGGNIYMYSGLMTALASDDEIAAVIAHEIGHCAARHTVKKFQASLGYNIISDLVFSQVEESSAKQLAAMGSNAVMGLIFSSYSRQDEYEADRLGVKYLYLAGYDPEAAVRVLELLEREAAGAQTPLFLRSHPHVSDRITVVKEEIPVVKQTYAQ